MCDFGLFHTGCLTLYVFKIISFFEKPYDNFLLGGGLILFRIDLRPKIVSTWVFPHSRPIALPPRLLNAYARTGEGGRRHITVGVIGAPCVSVARHRCAVCERGAVLFLRVMGYTRRNTRPPFRKANSPELWIKSQQSSFSLSSGLL